MQLGIGTFTFGWGFGIKDPKARGYMSGIDLLDYAHNHQLRVVQFGDNYPIHEMSWDHRELLRQKAIDTEITPELGARGLTLEHARNYIKIAYWLRAPILRFVIDGPGYEPSLDQVADIIRTLLSELESSNVILALENHDRWSARDYRHLIEAVGHSQVGICLDTANSIGFGEGLETVFEQLAPYAVNLHIKDFSVHRVSHQMGFTVEGTPAGRGFLDIPELVKALNRYGRCRSAILEQWTVPGTSSETTADTERLWAEKSLDYLIPLFQQVKS